MAARLCTTHEVSVTENPDEVLRNFVEVVFIKDTFSWKELEWYSDETDVVRQGIVLVRICNYILRTINHVTINDPRKISRFLDLLTVLRDPEIQKSYEVQNIRKKVEMEMEKSRLLREHSDSFTCCKKINLEQTSKALYWGDVKLMRVLIRYGVCPASTNDKKTKTEESETAGKQISPANRIKWGSQEILENDGAILFTHTCTADCRPHNDIYISIKHKSRRNYFVLAEILAIKQDPNISDDPCEKNGIRPNHSKCQKLLFQTLLEPCITYKEVEKCINEGKHERDEEHWSKALAKYKIWCPESCSSYQPRSLLHLSRCQVRSNILKVGVLPNLVAKLEVPYNLKRLILADSEDFIF